MKNMKVVTVTPAGRKEYLGILVPYLLKNREHIDEHHFWLNTQNEDDVAYIEEVTNKYPDFFKINRKPFHSKNSCDNIWQYFRDYKDDDALYIRLDDDIVFIDKDAIKNLIQFRLDNPKPLFVYGNIINNAICSFMQQQKGNIPLSWGRLSFWCLDKIGWYQPLFAARLHRKFLNDIKKQDTKKWHLENWKLDNYNRFSINVISWLGKDIAGLSELKIDNLATNYQTWANPQTGALQFPYDEEYFISQNAPEKLGRPNQICGNALFSHYSFFTQREYLNLFTNVLQDYYAIANVNYKKSTKLKSLQILQYYFKRLVLVHIRRVVRFIWLTSKNNLTNPTFTFIWRLFNRYIETPIRRIVGKTNSSHSKEIKKLIIEIKKTSNSNLKNIPYLTDLIAKTGLAWDPLSRGTYGDDANYMRSKSGGFYQIPRQLAEAICFLSEFKINTFFEIGTSSGWTTCLITAYLQRFNPELKVETVDVIAKFDSYDDIRHLLPITYLNHNYYRVFRGRKSDLCFINNGHSYDAVKKDYDHVGLNAKICMFHNIQDQKVLTTNKNNGGVPRFWAELKYMERSTANFYEFLWHSNDKKVMGIGIRVKK